METDDTKDNESGTFALHTLGENETIARLATGRKAFRSARRIQFHQNISTNRRRSENRYADNALEQLAQIFENRRQYPKAAEHWQRLLKEFPNAEKESPPRLERST